MTGQQLPMEARSYGGASHPSPFLPAMICMALAAMTFVVFGGTLRNGFVNFDDGLYVYENPMVTQGLTPKSVGEAFTRVHSANWHPLTWLSHMLDCQLYGLRPGGHHLTNVALHAATVIALFLVLRRMTGAMWRSAVVAAIFAVHPLRVESVAWIAERKDVLSGLFFLLTVGAYVRFAHGWNRPPACPSRPLAGWHRARRPLQQAGRLFHPWPNYGLVLFLFALGLMCKPMLVTLPLVLLLLDYWPLQRTEPWRRLLLEKIPLLALAAAGVVVTLLAQREAIHSGGSFALPLRLGNAAVSCFIYLRQMVWPADLAVLYPFPSDGRPWLEVALAVALLAGLSVAAWVARRQRPWILVGWLWYLVMLAPVLGIIQVGRQAHADRYTYLPEIGICIAVVWLVAEWRLNRAVAATVIVSVLSALMFTAWQQVQFWENSETLWRHTLACTADNDTAENNLGSYFYENGRMNEALQHFQTALRIRPDYAEAHHNLGLVDAAQGRLDDAIFQYAAALKAKPYYAEAHYNLGNALRQKGQLNDAITQYEQALQADPDYALAENNLGTTLSRMGRVDEAIAHFQKALELMPDHESVHFNLARALLQKGRFEEAISQYNEALQITPADIEVQNNLAWLLATCPQGSLRNGGRAVQLAQRANDLTGGTNAVILGTLAAALAETKQFPQAVEAVQRALRLAGTESNAGLAERLRSQLKIFQSGRPL